MKHSNTNTLAISIFIFFFFGIGCQSPEKKAVVPNQQDISSSENQEDISNSKYQAGQPKAGQFAVVHCVNGCSDQYTDYTHSVCASENKDFLIYYYKKIEGHFIGGNSLYMMLYRDTITGKTESPLLDGMRFENGDFSNPNRANCFRMLPEVIDFVQNYGEGSISLLFPISENLTDSNTFRILITKIDSGRVKFIGKLTKDDEFASLSKTN